MPLDAPTMSSLSGVPLIWNTLLLVTTAGQELFRWTEKLYTLRTDDYRPTHQNRMRYQSIENLIVRQ